MPGKLILKQVALALLIFLIVSLANQINTPWSNKVLAYVEYTLSEDSSLETRDLKALGIARLNLKQNTSQWKEQLFNKMKEHIDEFAERLNKKVDEIVSRWKE